MVRERDWPNALSCHANSSAAYTWDTTTKALGAHVLRVQDDSIITAVRSSQEGVPPKLVMASRCALPANGLEGDGQFRVFPARAQR